MRRKANTLFAGFHWTVQITKRLNKPQPDYSTMASRPSHILHPLVLQLSVALLPTYHPSLGHTGLEHKISNHQIQ